MKNWFSQFSEKSLQLYTLAAPENWKSDGNGIRFTREFLYQNFSWSCNKPHLSAGFGEDAAFPRAFPMGLPSQTAYSKMHTTDVRPVNTSIASAFVRWRHAVYVMYRPVRFQIEFGRNWPILTINALRFHDRRDSRICWSGQSRTSRIDQFPARRLPH